MALVFDEFERRVLGVLMEKTFTQASGDPLTLNAIVAGCNQKSNRDPVMELDEDTVWSTLKQLQERELVTRILPAPGSRADKFKHNVERVLQWQSPLRAVMTELFLRGPQTPGELRTRCSRMVEFKSLDDMSVVLETLRTWDPPLVLSLPRAPGQAAIRFAHLCYPPDEQPPQVDARAVAPHAAPRSPIAVAAAPPREDLAAAQSVRSELEDLQAEVGELHEELAELRRRVDQLEQRISS